jgi:hypothetical protein
MRFHGILFCLLVWGGATLWAQSVSIHGRHPDYAGKSIHITVAANPFLAIPGYEEAVICEEDGDFEHQFPLDTGRVVQFESGMYQTYLYMEPGYHYEVELPPYREKEYTDQMSPFRKSLVVPLQVMSRTDRITGNEVKGSAEVNQLIERFDSILISHNEEVVKQRRLGQRSNADSIIRQIDSMFTSDTSCFFSDYRRYRYGLMKLNEGESDLESVSREYLGPRVNVTHPGFVELSRVMFKDFLIHTSRTAAGEGLMYFINRSHDLDSVRHILRNQPAVWSDTLADMILLQDLSRLFYEGNLHKEAILILLDSMIVDPVSSDFALYTSQVKEKLASLVIGHPPPAFTLTDLQGRPFSLEACEGKYIYLMFCTPDHYGCMMEYPYLQSYYEKHADYLVVLTVMVAEDRSKVEEFMERNGYMWQALYYDDHPRVLEDYLVRAFPTAYLIGKDGNLILSPSPLPSDGFEQQLFRIMRSRGEI